MVAPASLACRALVWLAVAAMPFEALSIPTCACETRGRGQASSHEPPANEQPSCCCGASQPQREAPRESCRFGGSASDAKFRCDCGGGCLCARSERPSTPLPVAKETRSSSVSLTIPPVVAVLPIVDRPEGAWASRPSGLARTAPERCATLCRFVI